MWRPFLHCGILACAIFASLPAAANAQSLKNDEVLSSIILQPVGVPAPVLGADGRMHLAYELLAVNASPSLVTLDRIEALDQAGAVLATFNQRTLDQDIVQFAGKGTTLAPGAGAMVALDIALPPYRPLPKTIAERVSATRARIGPGGKPVPLEPGSPVPAHYVFTGASVALSPMRALTVEPPLRGKNWVAGGGCCETVTPHRATGLVVNGKLVVGQRFAIDWYQLDAHDRDVTGDPSRLSSYPSFGASVHSATDGVVVNLYDRALEQVPGHPKGVKAENIGGNMVVVKARPGIFAFYGHMQPGSLTIKLGDHVRVGQVIGLLGNTGNSTAPHLHFQLMDGPSPLNASGLPFVFTHFSSRGTLVQDREPMSDPSRPVTIDKNRLAGIHIQQMPLNDEVVDFD